MENTHMTSSLLALFLAVSTSSSYKPTFPGGGIIAWLICYRTRRDEIGGFLMLFFWHLYGGLIISAIFFVSNFQSYVPESFDDANRYHLLLLSAVPGLILYCARVIVGTLLLSVRTWEMLRLLRNFMLAELAFDLLGLFIDLKKFNDSSSTFLDIYTILVSSAWILYLFFSKRVRHVFKFRDWHTVVDRIYPDKLATV